MSQPYAPAAPWPAPPSPQAWQHPPPRAPKPERPLRPAVWWSVAINALYSLGICLFIGLVFGFIVLMIDVASAGEAGMSWTPAETAFVVGLLIVGFFVNLLVGIALTVGALLLLRIGAGFRTFPPFAQALLAAVCAFGVSSLLGAIVGVLTDFAMVAPAMFGQ